LPRDPLSVRYDRQAARLVGNAVKRHMETQGSPGPVLPRLVWVTVRVPSPKGDPVDSGGRTRHERALTRALYYDRRVNLHSPQKRWSLKLDWTDDVNGNGRKLRLRVFGDTKGARHASRAGGSYVRGEIRRGVTA
jgi:hypothetical protein